LFRPNIDRHYSYGKIEASAMCTYITLYVLYIYILLHFQHYMWIAHKHLIKSVIKMSYNS
jgi:hypothetical protein